MIHFDSEKCMEDFFFENFNSFAEELGAWTPDGIHAYRQVRLGKHGICDLLFLSVSRSAPDSKITVHVSLVELKNTAIGISDIAQVARYKSFFDDLRRASRMDINFHSCLVGLKTFPATGDLCFLCQTIDWLDVYEVALDPSVGVCLSLVRDWRPKGCSDEDLRKFVGDFVLPFARVPEVVDG